MESKNVETSRLVRLLVRSMMGIKMGGSDGDRNFESMVLYVNRILSSRSFLSRTKDEFQMKGAILSRYGEQDAASTKLRMQFEAFFDQLSNKPLKEKGSILQLLNKLSRRQNEHTKATVPMMSFARHFTTMEPAKKEEPIVKPATIKYPEKNTPPSTQIPEQRLLRDIIFVLQGIDGRYITFNKSLNAFSVSPEVGASSPERRLLHLICEGGWLFRRVDQYLKSTTAQKGSGLVEQSFCGAMQSELTHYFHQIATLESEMNAKSVDGLGRSRLTMRGIHLWSLQVIENLRLMAMIVDSVKGMKGGALISSIATYMRHGDPTVSSFVKNILEQTCVPLFKQIGQWMSMAELEDPFQEFFVVSKRSVPKDRLWQDRFSLSREMLPTFIDRRLALKILSVGKAINFIQVCCKGAPERKGEKKSKVANPMMEMQGLRFEDVTDGARGLREVVDKTAAAINARLMDVMLNQFGVRKHCLALKKYLLLGQGDFITRLLDLLSTELDEPASKIFRHNLVMVLKAAIQQSNAQYEDQDVLSRLDIRLLRGVNNDYGWDVFSLDYHVGMPLNVILHKEAINKYLRVFSFLWKLKRIEHALVKCWNMHTTNANTLQRGTHRGIAGMLKKGYLIRMEMHHFVQNLTSYMMFEVLECAWAEFDEEMKKAKNLDALIDAHERYLAQILSGAMMDEGTNSDTKKTSRTPLLEDLKRMFDVILQFVRLQEHVYEAALLDIKTDADKKKRIYKRQQLGKWGQTAEDDQKESSNAKRLTQETSSKVYERLLALEESFARCLSSFRARLSEHTSSDAQFLDVRLDFNEFYHEQRQREARKAGMTSPTKF